MAGRKEFTSVDFPLPLSLNGPSPTSAEDPPPPTHTPDAEDGAEWGSFSSYQVSMFHRLHYYWQKQKGSFCFISTSPASLRHRFPRYPRYRHRRRPHQHLLSYCWYLSSASSASLPPGSQSPTIRSHGSKDSQVCFIQPSCICPSHIVVSFPLVLFANCTTRARRRNSIFFNCL